MGVDYSGLAYPKGDLRIEHKREKRLTDAEREKQARLAVRIRDGRRCAVPGCREAGVQLHHVVYRSRSKKLRWATSNLCYLCVAHHRLQHAGRIHVSGNADDELVITGAKKDLAFKL
jgi:5-methylcytosine-specific restriction endonuclease McrA